jgi:hypothetical protein
MLDDSTYSTSHGVIGVQMAVNLETNFPISLNQQLAGDGNGLFWSLGKLLENDESQYDAMRQAVMHVCNNWDKFHELKILPTTESLS